MTGPEEAERWASIRGRLALVRDERPQPGRDDKVLTEWNAMYASALAERGETLLKLGMGEAGAESVRLAARISPELGPQLSQMLSGYRAQR